MATHPRPAQDSGSDRAPVTFAYRRPVVADLLKALAKGPQLLQIVIGPRQVGKTTAVLQVSQEWPGETVFAAADGPLPPGPEWVETHWERATRACRGNRGALLVLDEIQKVRGWSGTIKSLWDQERRRPSGLKVILLGSSALLVQKGLSESLAGRFFLHRCTHWNYPEMRKAFGWSLDEWIFFGGYPGAAAFRNEEAAWRNYVVDSLVETVLSRDVLQMNTVAKPALLRHLFGLATAHPAEILSYNKMLGQLQDAGNTTTLAHYLQLLGQAYLVSGLEAYRVGSRSKRGSSPKLILWNNALVTAFRGEGFAQARRDTAFWGRLVENAVGAHILQRPDPTVGGVYYWRQGDEEVDFILTTGKAVTALEVKSGRQSRATGLATFRGKYPGVQARLVGSGGIPLEEYFSGH